MVITKLPARAQQNWNNSNKVDVFKDYPYGEVFGIHCQSPYSEEAVDSLTQFPVIDTLGRPFELDELKRVLRTTKHLERVVSCSNNN